MDQSQSQASRRCRRSGETARQLQGHWGRIRAARPPRTIPDRRTALGRVLPFWPHELEDESLPARRRIADRLRRALRAERRRGIAGHWTYDLARHFELLRLFREELAALSGSARRHAQHTDARSDDRR